MPQRNATLSRRPPRHPGPPLLVRRGSVAESVVVPQTGGALILTASALINTYTAWTAIGTPLAQPMVLSQFKVHISSLVNGTLYYLVEFGYGSAPTPFEAVRWVNRVTVTDPTGDDTITAVDGATYDARPWVFPAGTQLYARARQSAAWAVPGNYEIMVLGWDDAYPDFTPLPEYFARGAGRLYPSNVDGGTLVVTPGVWGTWGAWKEVVARAPNDMLVMGIVPHASLGNFGVTANMVQVGYGPAGAEVPAAALLWAHSTAAFLNPPVWVKAGERLVLRSQGDATTGRIFLVKVVDLY